MDQDPTCSIYLSQSGIVPVVQIDGLFDASGAALFTAKVAGLPGGKALGVVLDLSALRYASSAGIGAIVALHRRVRAAGGILVLAQPSLSVGEMLTTLNIASIMPIQPTVERGIIAARGL